MLVRPATSADVEAITAIFNFEVEHGLSNYESRLHSSAERREWLAQLQQSGYPVLVAQSENAVVGFAALTPFHSLSGYRFTVTGSIYVDSRNRGNGVGRALAAELFAGAVRRGYHSVLAGVSSENSASIALLKSFGFEEVGRFREIGWKKGQWRDDVCLQLIFPGSEKPSTP